ncbi:hypothetical protein WMY93_017920 [Mugilogobius chulae]|uniref:Protein aurora borealis n=1 Tax=Mugilogobius chulae TaxID=88201 RepID=A0AAW0NP89_9GOBI
MYISHQKRQETFNKKSFESPNDYHHLREPVVPSPSVFKTKTCKATPPKFTWSIEEMASLFPVHIDQEEIQRQSFYLNQTRTDSDIEQKCQNAIDHFFTKGSIVPSPWASQESRKVGTFCKKSTVSPLIAENPRKISVGCQTMLSLPLTFDLEKVLGEYYRYEEPCDPVQESLSSSSLRRKLFLDGQGSGSDSSTPSSPERGLSEQPRLQEDGTNGATENMHIPELETTSSIFSSPLSCAIKSTTPSTGQFSSSPIQNGRFRDCSLGSMNSPVLPDRSSPEGLASPIISPIFAQASCTPITSKSKPPACLTPLNVPLDGDITSCIESPFVEGCSPIQSCSPHQPKYNELKNYSRAKLRNRVGFWASPPPISPILNPRLQDCEELEDLQPLPSMDLDPVPLTTDGFKEDNINNLKPLAREEVGGKEIEERVDDEELESKGQESC